MTAIGFCVEQIRETTTETNYQCDVPGVPRKFPPSVIIPPTEKTRTKLTGNFFNIDREFAAGRERHPVHFATYQARLDNLLSNLPVNF